jgi:hypothetical protein
MAIVDHRLIGGFSRRPVGASYEVIAAVRLPAQENKAPNAVLWNKSAKKAVVLRGIPLDAEASSGKTVLKLFS